MTKKELEEIRQEILEESRKESLLEHKMYTNEEYAWEQFSERYNLCNSIQNIKNFIDSMKQYGWEYTVPEIFDVC